MNDQEPLRSDEQWKEFLKSHRDVLDLMDRVQQSKKAEQETWKNLDTAGDDDASSFKRAEGLGHSPSDLPTNIGRFEIQSLLGQGGHGLVFCAFDPQLKRQVALKIPRPEAVMTGDLRDRFIREAEMAASLNHANIVPVFEVGNFGPVCFIASRYVPGVTLAEWMNNLQGRGEQLGPEEAARMAVAICEAVQHAHSRDVIHRDLKPENILVESTASGRSGDDLDKDSVSKRLRITDFGLAKSLDETAGLTQTGSLIGTPSYMAPEQINSKDRSVGPAADVYALGAVLYFLLCGRPPFGGSTLLETIKLVENESPPRPSGLQRGLPHDVEAICLKCLEKNPSRRYETASSLQNDLTRFLVGMPVSARTPSLLDRALMWCHRRPAVAALASALVAVLLIGTVLLGLALARSNSLKNQAEVHSVKAEAERDRTRQALDAMTSDVAASWLSGQEELSKEQTKFLEATINYYREFAENEITGSEDRFWVASAENRLAQMLAMLGRMGDAIKSVNRAIDLLQNSPEDSMTTETRRELAIALRRKAAFLQQMGKNDNSLTLDLEAVNVARIVFAEAPQDIENRKMLASALGDAGNQLRRSGRLKESLQLQLESISINEELASTNTNNLDFTRKLGIGYMNLGVLLIQMRQLDEAAIYLEKSRGIREDLVAAHPDVARLRADLGWTLDNLGGLAQRRGELDDAQSWIQQAVNLRRELVREFPLDESYRRNLVNSICNSAFIAGEREELEQMQSLSMEVIELAEQSTDDFPGVTVYRVIKARAELNLGSVAADQGKHDQAMTMVESAISDLKRLIEENMEVQTATQILETGLSQQATLLSELGRHEAAIDSWNQAIHVANPGGVNNLRLCRATSRVKLGELTEALEDVEQIIQDTMNLPADQRDSNVFYNAGCVHALVSERVKEPDKSRDHAMNAIDMLNRAIEAGFRPMSHLRNDPELQTLNDYPEFQALINKNLN